MAFSDAQVKLLSGKLNPAYVKTRDHRGKTLSYIEGWHAIAEANRIFGFDGWDRETMLAECVWQDMKREPKACAYTARVRIRVRAAETVVYRDGSGVGYGTASTAGEAHESALKEAETDATKRAFASFGNLFGLALYDREQNGVRRPRNGHGSSAVGIYWVLLSGTGARLNKHDMPEGFCGALRHALEASPTAKRLEALWSRNHPTVMHLRRSWPDLKTVNGTHYADVLEGIYQHRLEQLRKAESQEPTQSAEPTEMAGVDKSLLRLAEPKRLRDRDHLQFVSSLPCLVCGRTPSQAHHLRFAQPRAMGRKVSDEWTVPLCFVHHRALHDDGAEEKWWRGQGINPIAEAEKLWQQSRRNDAVPAAEVSAGTAPGSQTDGVTLPA